MDPTAIGEITGSGGPDKYSLLKRNLAAQPDYGKMREELGGYVVAMSETPTFAELTKQLAHVMAYRNRVHQMYIDAIINRRKFKRIWEIVHDTELPGRQEKSQEQREAGVRATYRDFYDTFKVAEDWLEIVYSSYNNLASANENISRQITALQEEAKMEGMSQTRAVYPSPSTPPPPLTAISSPAIGPRQVGWGDVPKQRGMPFMSGQD